MTPPTTLRLAGLAATVLALALMMTNRPAVAPAASVRPEFAFAVAQLAETEATLASLHALNGKLASLQLAVRRARPAVWAVDSTIAVIRPAPAVTLTVHPMAVRPASN